MEVNPYKSPQEPGYFQPRPRIINDWLRDRAAELALGLLVAIMALPFVMAACWILGYFP